MMNLSSHNNEEKRSSLINNHEDKDSSRGIQWSPAQQHHQDRKRPLLFPPSSPQFSTSPSLVETVNDDDDDHSDAAAIAAACWMEEEEMHGSFAACPPPPLATSSSLTSSSSSLLSVLQRNDSSFARDDMLSSFVSGRGNSLLLQQQQQQQLPSLLGPSSSSSSLSTNMTCCSRPDWWDRMQRHVEAADSDAVLEESVLQADLAEETARRMQDIIRREWNHNNKTTTTTTCAIPSQVLEDSSPSSSWCEDVSLLEPSWPKSQQQQQQHVLSCETEDSTSIASTTSSLEQAVDESNLQVSFCEQTVQEMRQVLSWWETPHSGKRQSESLRHNSLVCKSPSSVSSSSSSRRSSTSSTSSICVAAASNVRRPPASTWECSAAAASSLEEEEDDEEPFVLPPPSWSPPRPRRLELQFQEAALEMSMRSNDSQSDHHNDDDDDETLTSPVEDASRRFFSSSQCWGNGTASSLSLCKNPRWEARQQVSAVDAVCLEAKRMADLLECWNSKSQDEDDDFDDAASAVVQVSSSSSSGDLVESSWKERCRLCLALQLCVVRCYIHQRLVEHTPMELLAAWLWLHRHPRVRHGLIRFVLVTWPILMATAVVFMFALKTQPTWYDDANDDMSWRLVRFESAQEDEIYWMMDGSMSFHDKNIAGCRETLDWLCEAVLYEHCVAACM